MLARVSFFLKLGIADLLCYTIPRLLCKVFVRLPRAIARLVLWRSRRDPGELGERDVEVIYNHCDSSVARAFGLVGDGAVTGDVAAGEQPASSPPAMLRHSRCPSLRYSGPLYNGHIHTIFNGLRPVWHRFEYARHLVQSADGQHLNLDVLLPSMLRRGANAKAPPPSKDAVEEVEGVFFVVPGLLNASTTNYVRNFAYQMASRHFGVAVLNYRGMGSTPLEVPRLFSATFTDDIRHILEHHFNPAQVRALVAGGGTVPASAGDGAADGDEKGGGGRNIPLIGVGFSLGGVTLIKYVSEEGLKMEKGEQQALGCGDGSCGNGACRLDAVIAVTSPFDLVACDEATQRAVYKAFYEPPFAIGFRKFVKHNQKMIESLPNVDGKALFNGPHPLIKTMTSIRVFDELINATHNGYATVSEYYAAANSLPWLKHCHTPCVCISNRGDPVTGPAIPSEEWESQVVRDNRNVLYVCFPVGGHLGFVGRPWQEVSGGPNIMERFVLDTARCFAESAKQGFTAL